VFTYSWSGFPGRTEDVLARYYDAMIYMATWGSRQLVFRFPKALFDPAQIRVFIPAFDFDERVSLATVGEYAILNIEFHTRSMPSTAAVRRSCDACTMQGCIHPRHDRPVTTDNRRCRNQSSEGWAHKLNRWEEDLLSSL
jgi:hypothetical protein